MEDEKGSRARGLRAAALSSVPTGGVEAVLYGDEQSLPKRREIKERIEGQRGGVVVNILDDADFPEGISMGERSYARRAVANIFLISPGWASFGPAHELTHLIEYGTLASVAVIHPAQGTWGRQFTSQSAKEVLELIPGQCHGYPEDSWEECSEITRLCDVALFDRWRLLELLPNRTEVPRLLE